MVMGIKDNPIIYSVAPTDDQSSIIFELVEDFLQRAGFSKYLSTRVSPYRKLVYQCRKTGHKSTYNARTGSGNGIRGRKAHLLIIDESAFVGDKVKSSVLYPILADYDGDLIEISTPNGANSFEEAFTQAKAGEEDSAAFQFKSLDNPHISKSYIEKMRQKTPTKIFLQEYEAEFLVGEFCIFGDVDSLVEKGVKERDPMGKRVYFGLDLAKTVDNTALSGFTEDGVQIRLDYFNQLPYKMQIEKVCAILSLYPNCAVTVDATGVGVAVVEMLREQLDELGLKNVTVTEYVFNNTSKLEAVMGAAVRFEKRDVRLLDDESQTRELKIYETKKTASGNYTFNAPKGSHDDIVTANILALWSIESANSWMPVVV